MEKHYRALIKPTIESFTKENYGLLVLKSSFL